MKYSETTMTTYKAWHFCASDKRLAYNDGREIVVGETLTVEGRPVLCEHGLHGSVSVMDALTYAPGPILCAVEISGDVQEGIDKIVGQRRKTLAMVDVSETLRIFARQVAIDAADLWDCPPVVRCFLKTGESAKEARDAAWAKEARTEAPREAAREAARTAVSRAAEWAAEWAAARAAEKAREALTWARAAERKAEYAEEEEDMAAARAQHERRLLHLLQEQHPNLFQ